MKHISPLQRHVFLPLTYRIFKKKLHIFTISSPFCHDWQRVQEARKFHPKDIKMIKDDQGGTRNPYKCMNVMKQDAMDNKIIERCKTCEKQISQQEKNVKHIDLKIHTHTHTHTQNKSNQFYISKTSQDSLVSIH